MPAAARRGDAIFITGRFRSGSTLLRNLLRSLDGFTSYYEPLNMFYYIWKLSYLSGARHAHVSLRFEDLVASPRRGIQDLLAALDVHGGDLEKLVKLVSPPVLGKWWEYAGDGWFREHESAYDRVLADFFTTRAV